jgi:hypothetical protein
MAKATKKKKSAGKDSGLEANPNVDQQVYDEAIAAGADPDDARELSKKKGD